jgi:HK97 family phage prohead protease
MSKTLHPKILALRNSVGYRPMYEFWPSRKKYDQVPMDKREIKTSENDRLIKQYFAIWGVPDDYGTEPMPGCFTKSIKERGPDTSATNKIVVLNQHNQRSPLCLPNLLKEDDTGLYGEYEPDEDIEENDVLVKRVKKGTINGGSYGFQYNWDEMRYDDKTDTIKMFDTILFEVSPVTLASQGGTFVVRGKIFDEDLQREMESFIRKIPRKFHMELRSLISEHISLVNSRPLERRKALGKNSKPKKVGIDYDYLLENLNL